MVSGVYVIKNTRTGWVYVGSTRDIRKRFCDWGRHMARDTAPSSMLKDLKAGSPGDFIFKLVKECPPDAKSLHEWESKILDAIKDKYPEKIYNYATPCRNHARVKEKGDDEIRSILSIGKVLDTSRLADTPKTKYIINGESAYAIAKRNGISDALLYYRINQYGWDLKRATTEPPRKYVGKKK